AWWAADRNFQKCTLSRLDRIPPYSDDTPVEIALERSGKNEEAGCFLLFESNEAKIRSAFARDDRHDTIVPEQHLKASIRLRLLPKCIDLGFSTMLDDNCEAYGSGFEKFHGRV